MSGGISPSVEEEEKKGCERIAAWPRASFMAFREEPKRSCGRRRRSFKMRSLACGGTTAGKRRQHRRERRKTRYGAGARKGDTPTKNWYRQQPSAHKSASIKVS
jgi:hypothetical protein